MNQEKTVFQKIIDGELPAEKVWEDERCIAILDLFPANPGHTLVISKHPYPDLFAIDEETLCHCHRVAKRLAKAIKRATDCEGINILQNNGSASGQIIFHYHIHIIPRYTGDGLQIPKSGPKADEDYMREWGEKIRQDLEETD